MIISLREAMANERLADFVDQEINRKIGPISSADFDKDVAVLVKAPQPRGQTSGSRAHDDSNGKKTR